MRGLQRFSIFAGTNQAIEALQVLKKVIFGFAESEKAVALASYQDQFALAAGCQRAWSFAAGRMGLFAILKALQIEPGDEVILPAFSCVVVPNALLYAGVKPVYVDIDRTNFNLRLEHIEGKINSKTRAIYIQHTFGQLVDILQVREWARKYNLKIIEDSAHALGIQGERGLVGSLGDMAFFSSDHSKVINTGYGGMVTTNDPVLAARMDRIYSQIPDMPLSLRRKINGVFLLEFLIYRPLAYPLTRYFKRLLGFLPLWTVFAEELVLDKQQLPYYPCRLSPEMALVGLHQLAQLKDNLAHRKKVVEVISRVLGIPSGSAPLLRVSFFVRDREAFKKVFSSHFDLGIWFTTIMQGREDHWEEIGYRLGECPQAEWVAKHIVNFPTHPLIDPIFLEKILKERKHAIELIRV